MKDRRENRHPSMDLTRFRSPFGVPVSCEIYVRINDDGSPEILSSVEIEGSGENRILCQVEVDEQEVLLLYRQYRRRPENQNRIRRVYLWDLRTKKRTFKQLHG